MSVAILIFLSAVRSLAEGGEIHTSGLDMVWAVDYGLDIRGHCRFSVTMAEYGDYKIELHGDNTSEVPPYRVLFSRNMVTPSMTLETCNETCTADNETCSEECTACAVRDLGYGSLADETEIRIYWRSGLIYLNLGDNSIELYDPHAKNIRFVKLGGGKESTTANFTFQNLTGNPTHTDSGCSATTVRTFPNSTLPIVYDLQGRHSFKTKFFACRTFRLNLYDTADEDVPRYDVIIDEHANTASWYVGICRPDCLRNRVFENYAGCTDGRSFMWVSWQNNTISIGRGDVTGTNTVMEVKDPHFTEISVIKTSEVAIYARATIKQPQTPTGGLQVQITNGQSNGLTTSQLSTINNCPKQHRPDSENLSLAFVRVANDTTLSPTNPGLIEITSADTGSCATKCASLQTCVLYSISDTGVCRITDNCQPFVESEPNTHVLSLSYWG